jgi:NADPH:quinone reductase-like Zn-dependent oxidoreductase
MLRVLALISLFCSAFVEAEGFREVVITGFGGPEVLEVREHEQLPEPGPGEVRLRVLTASASFTDVMVRKGTYPGIDDELPYPPGYDLVGVVDALGEGVTGLSPGQRVADLSIWGAYTEYAVRPAAQLVPVPEGLDDAQAVALILSYTTAYQMLHRVAQVQVGQRILIHGASGAVGTALAQLGSVSGLEMYGTASAAKQGYVRSLGVTPIDYRSEDFVARIDELTDGAGVAAVFDAVGLDNFKRSYSVLAPGGRLVTYGFYRANLTGDGMMDVVGEFLGYQWQQLLWRWLPEDGRKAGFYSIADMRAAHPDWFRQDLAALFGLLAEGNIRPTIWKILPLTEAATAHRHIEAGDVVGKIVLRANPR